MSINRNRNITAPEPEIKKNQLNYAQYCTRVPIEVHLPRRATATTTKRTFMADEIVVMFKHYFKTVTTGRGFDAFFIADKVGRCREIVLTLCLL